MKKLLMAMVLVVCATVGSAQGMVRRTFGKGLQRLAPSAARNQQLHKTTTNGVEWTYEIIDGGAFLGGGWGNHSAISQKTSGAIIIPEALVGIPVRGIGSGAFFCCSNLTSVTIPSGVTNIGDHAFYVCRGLTTVTIPANVKSIGDDAFLGCRELESVTMRGERPDVKGNVFDKCENLAAIHVPASAKSWKGMKAWQRIPLVFDAVAK